MKFDCCLLYTSKLPPQKETRPGLRAFASFRPFTTLPTQGRRLDNFQAPPHF